MGLKLYMTDLSPPVRAVLLAEKALEIELEHVELNLATGDHLKPDYVKLNPQHTVPLLVDGEVVIADSHAILAYLTAKFMKHSFYPEDIVKRAVVDQRLHFDSGSVFCNIRNIVGKMLYKKAKTVDDESKARLITAYNFLNIFLENETWMAGDEITIADFSLISSITTANVLVPIEPGYKNLLAWIKRAESLPYYDINQKGLENFKLLIKKLTA